MIETLLEAQTFLDELVEKYYSEEEYDLALTISGEPEALLKDLSKLSGNDLNKTLKKALATEAYFARHAKVGYKILIQAPDGELREVLLKCLHSYTIARPHHASLTTRTSPHKLETYSRALVSLL